MKNKMMRIASVLMVAVILSVCAVSGSFAKYVTSFEGTDSARVAKWGVFFKLEGDGLSVFAPEYEADDTSYAPVFADSSSTVTVLSAKGDNVVAPGTKRESAKVSLTGKPEVAVRLGFNVTELEVPFIKANTVIKDYTKLVLIPSTSNGDGEATETTTAEYGYADYTVKKDYYPILFKLSIYPPKAMSAEQPQEATRGGAEEPKPMEFEFRTLDELKAKMEEDGATVDISPNSDLDGVVFTLSWEWVFPTVETAEEELTAVEVDQPTVRGEAAELTPEEIDILDTYLGNEENLQTVSIALALTATQID